MSSACVHVNGRFLFSDHATGTHRSAEGFCRALFRAREGRELRLWCNPAWPRAQAFCEEVGIEPSAISANSTAALHFWEQTAFAQLSAKAIGLSLLGTGPVWSGSSRQVMLVHDLNSLIVPEIFSRKYRLWASFAKYSAIKRANRLFCLTDFVRQSIVDRLAVPAERITVIPQGPGVPALEQNEEILPFEQRKHFLCAGSLQPHKNLPRVLEAWEKSGLAATGRELLIVGKKQKNFAGAGHGAASSGVRFTGYVSDEELAALYRSSLAVVYPSLHEGFGLPLVEAFFAGTPVITSSVSCLPEVGGGAAILVDPHDASAIAQSMKTLSADHALWRRQVDLGWHRREHFRWKHAGEKLWNLLATVSA